MTSPAHRKDCLNRYLRKMALWLFPLFTGLPGMGCIAPKVVYEPGEVERFLAGPGNLDIDYVTKWGQQHAYYTAPGGNPSHPPRPLVICAPGIGGSALGWETYVQGNPNPEAGILYIDYPGRGRNAGIMRPREMPEHITAALDRLAERTALPLATLNQQVVLVGHSFGTGVALEYACRQKPEAIILFAPFDTLKRAMARVMGPLAWIIPDNYDSLQNARTLLEHPPPPRILVIHGLDDTVLPIEMGRRFRDTFNGQVEYHELPGTDHRSVLLHGQPFLFSLLRDFLP